MKTLEQALSEVAYGYPKEFIDLLTFTLPAEAVFEHGHQDDYDFVTTENSSSDPGGLTFLGLDQASHPHLDLENMTFAEAVAEYHSDTWLPLRCDEITSEQVAISLCDAAINCGAVRAVKWLQGAAQAAVDGNIGPMTLHGVNMMDGDDLAAQLNNARQDYYENQVRPSLRAIYEKGWLARLANLKTYIAQFP